MADKKKPTKVGDGSVTNKDSINKSSKSETHSEHVEDLKREISNETKSASYCCEAAFSINVEELPTEDAFM